jgi:uncharacterized damage-inducible protein DinB
MADPLLATGHFVLTDAFKDMRAALERLPDEALNWKPGGEETNTIAVLVTHMLHSTRSWLSVAVAAPLPDRDRDEEFRTEGSSAKALLAFFDDYSGQCLDLLKSEDDIDWAANRKTHMRPDPNLPDYVPASFALLHAIEHVGEHVAHVTMTRQLRDARQA